MEPHWNVSLDFCVPMSSRRALHVTSWPRRCIVKRSPCTKITSPKTRHNYDHTPLHPRTGPISLMSLLHLLPHRVTLTEALSPTTQVYYNIETNFTRPWILGTVPIQVRMGTSLFPQKDFVASNSNDKRVAGKKYIDSINHRHITLYVCESIHHRMKVCH